MEARGKSRRGDGDDVLAKPAFFLSLEWINGKHRKIGDAIPSRQSSQPILLSHHCAVRWIIVLGLWLNIFVPETDQALHKTIFKGSNTALAPGTRLIICQEWRHVPVLLYDRSVFVDKDKVCCPQNHKKSIVTLNAQYCRRKLR